MRTFKIIDCWLQMATIAVCLVLSVSGTLAVYYAYFIVGGVQFISMLVHEAAHFFVTAGTPRRRYHNIVYIIVVCMIVSVWLEPFLFVFVPLLFTAPFMAAYYLRLCYKETYVYLKRPLSILK